MRLLMAPRAAARRCSTSAHCSSSLRPRRTLSSWPMTFFVRVTRSSFSREVCDIFPCIPYWGMVSRVAPSLQRSSAPYRTAPQSLRAVSTAAWRARRSVYSRPSTRVRRSSAGNERPFILGYLPVEVDGCPRRKSRGFRCADWPHDYPFLPGAR
jgi:hypothetical protein